MATGILALASGAFLTACSAFGVRTVDEPPHRKLAQLGEIEIRSYGPRLAAETVVAGDQIAARSKGFRRLANYIFGANRAPLGIATNAPVTQAITDRVTRKQADASASIAMTAPVDQAQDLNGGWRIRFFMPAHYRPETLPEPLDDAVRIVTVPTETVAVLRYSGVASARAVRIANTQLLQALAGTAWSALGTPMAWFYDPPWTIPPLRRNEAVVQVTRRENGR